MELLAALWIKLYRSYDVQQTMVGGLRPDGEDATNDVSLMVLEVTRGLGFVRCLSVRLHQRQPAPARRTGRATWWQTGGGIPFFFNDDTLIPGLVANGIAVGDARDYAAIGCIEITIPGKAYPHAVSHWINLAKCLELALNDGRDPRDGAQVGPRTGASGRHALDRGRAGRPIPRQVRFFVEHCVYGSNRRRARARGDLRAALSLAADRRLRAARGRYHLGRRALQLPFERRDGHPERRGLAGRAGAARLRPSASSRRRSWRAALAANFAGQEELRQALLHRAPKYGNDAPARGCLGGAA